MIRTGSCYTISIKQNRLYISKSLRKKNKTFSPSAFCYIVRKKQDNVNICVLSFPFFLYPPKPKPYSSYCFNILFIFINFT